MITFEEYSTKALAFAAPNPYADMPNNLFDMVHGAVGIGDEIAELSEAIAINKDDLVFEETQDLIWFCNLEIVAAGGKFDKELLAYVSADEPSEYAVKFVAKYDRNDPTVIANVLSGLVKKPFAYGGERVVDTAEVIEHTKLILIGCDGLLSELYPESSPAERWSNAFEANLNKLGNSRYKSGKFSQEAEFNRDSEADTKAAQ